MKIPHTFPPGRFGQRMITCQKPQHFLDSRAAGALRVNCLTRRSSAVGKSKGTGRDTKGGWAVLSSTAPVHRSAHC
jgi:hypothetical protein